VFLFSHSGRVRFYSIYLSGKMKFDYIPPTEFFYFLASTTASGIELSDLKVSNEHSNCASFWFILNKLDFEKTFDNINWSYLLLIFQRRGFSSIWMSSMRRVLWKDIMLSFLMIQQRLTLNVRKEFVKTIHFHLTFFY
jgi:hypothetical protein